MADIFPFLPASLREILPGELRPGLSAQSTIDDAIDFLENQGFGVARNQIERAFRRVEAQSRFRDELIDISVDRLIPRALHVEDHGFQLTTKYMYRTKATGTEPLTGQRIDHYFTITSNSQMSPDDVFREILEATSGLEGDYKIQIDSFELDAAFINPEFI